MEPKAKEAVQAVTPAQKSKQKRVRTVSNETNIADLATPNRVAAIRSQAKAKGLATPSPGRANAALTMLELTSSAKIEEPQLCSRNLRYDPPTLRDTCKRVLSIFDDRGQIPVDVEELVNKYAFDEDLLLEALNVLGVFNIVVNDPISTFSVWNGCGVAESSLKEVILLAHVSTSTSKVHLTRRLVEALVKFEAEELKKGRTSPTWTLQQISSQLQDLENEVMEDLVDIAGILCDIGLTTLVEKADNPNLNIYKWAIENPVQYQPSPFPPQSGPNKYGFYSSLTPNPRPTFSLRQVTPLDSVSKAATSRPTPQSADFYRGRSRRARDSNLARRVLEDPTSFEESPLVGGIQLANNTGRTDLPASGVRKRRIQSLTKSAQRRNNANAPTNLSAKFTEVMASPSIRSVESDVGPCLAAKIARTLISKVDRQKSDPLPTPSEMYEFQFTALRKFMQGYYELYNKLSEQEKSQPKQESSSSSSSKVGITAHQDPQSTKTLLPPRSGRQLQRGNSLVPFRQPTIGMLEEFIGETDIQAELSKRQKLKESKKDKTDLARTDTIDSLKYVAQNPSMTELDIQSLMEFNANSQGEA